MKFYCDLYLGENVKKPKRIIRKLKSKRKFPLPNTYVITMPYGTDQLEIYEAKYLKQSFYRRNPPFVVGIAHGYKEALDLVIQIVNESMEKRGDCNLKSYLEEQESVRG